MSALVGQRKVVFAVLLPKQEREGTAWPCFRPPGLVSGVSDCMMTSSCIERGVGNRTTVKVFRLGVFLLLLAI